MIIMNFIPLGGKHCITTSLKQVFNFYKYPISEEMLFGIGSGISFAYLNLANSPMITGRIKPFKFEEKIAKRLNVEIKCKTSKQYDIVFEKTKKIIDNNKPVMVYVDMPYLKYLNLQKDSHFGGHSIVIFGYDEEKKGFYISDRDNLDNPINTPKGKIFENYHFVSFKEMEKARSSNSRPFPANNKYMEFNFEKIQPITKEIIIEAIIETCDCMLNPPAQLLGLNGIKKFSKEILKWEKFDKKKLKFSGITNYFMINADGGTGGGIFRKMYGDFLCEASKICKNNAMNLIGKNICRIGNKWEEIASLFWKLGETANISILKQMSEIAIEIFDQESNIFNELRNKIIW